MYEGHIYSLHQNLNLNSNSIDQKGKTSLYCSKLSVSPTDTLNEGGIKIKKIIYSQCKSILKPFIYRLILVCNYLKGSQRRDCLSRLSFILKTFNHAVQGNRELLVQSV